MKSICLAAVAMALAVLFSVGFVAKASAQANRTWVSGVGDDANPCSRTAPCKNFAGAISKTAVGGEINVLDPGGFGSVTITKSITIRTDGVLAGVASPLTNGVIVNLPNATDRVMLEGLDIDGAGTGLSGVRMLGLGRLTVLNCNIRNFTARGVEVAGRSGARVTIIGSTIENTSFGVRVEGAAGAGNVAHVERTVLNLHGTAAAEVASASTLVLDDASLINSTVGLSVLGTGAAISYGNNVIRNGGTPTQTLPLR